MEREIKFRVWDDDAEQMIYSDSHEIDTADYWWEIDPLRVGCITGSTGGNNFEPPEPIVTYYDKIMQFTGLPIDKNGKKIYEGDIIKGYLTIEGDNYDFKDVVIFNNGRFQCENNADFELWHYDLEIIGNIYETPDLLEL